MNQMLQESLDESAACEQMERDGCPQLPDLPPLVPGYEDIDPIF